MLNSEEDKSVVVVVDDEDFSSIIASSLRNVIENSVVDLVLPYRILSISHLSSWNTFQQDLNQILKQNFKINQDFLLFNHLDFHRNGKVKEEEEEDDHDNDDRYFQCLINSHIDFIPIKSDFDRLYQLMYTS